MILRARLVLPMAAPAIEDAAIVVSGERIVSVDKWNDVRPHATGHVDDLGEVVVLPGLINAHCHLDYTNMAGKISPPRSF
ncbi:MAG TPA: amidohydrolase, partial [Candidatus Binatia bacterium]|nr:amidohydrolase [Candidatus Binatia bacterium]